MGLNCACVVFGLHNIYMFQVERSYVSLRYLHFYKIPGKPYSTLAILQAMVVIPHKFIMEADLFACQKVNVEDLCWFPGVYSSIISICLVSKLLDDQDLCYCFSALFIFHTFESHSCRKNPVPLRSTEHFALWDPRCNETILEFCFQVLHRWMLDLDPAHLDEAKSDCKKWLVKVAG